MTDPQDPPKPPVGATQQLAALVEEVPEEPEGEGPDGDESEDELADGESGGEGEVSLAPTTSKAPPLLPKEKKQVRTKAVLIGVAVFVACTALALGVVVMLGLHHPPQVAQPARRPAPPTPTSVAARGATPPAHHTIQLDEFVFTAGADAGPAAP